MHRPAFGDSVHIIHGVLCRYLPTEKLLSSNINLLRVPYSVQYITLLLKFSIHALLSFILQPSVTKQTSRQYFVLCKTPPKTNTESHRKSLKQSELCVIWSTMRSLSNCAEGRKFHNRTIPVSQIGTVSGHLLHVLRKVDQNAEASDFITHLIVDTGESDR